MDNSSNMFTVTRPVNREFGEDLDPMLVDHEYFLWLCNRVKLDGGLHGQEEIYIKPETSNITCFTLGHILYSTPFVVLVPHDENRAADGKQMRYYFSTLGPGYKDCSALDREFCSVLEMLVGLTGRMNTNVLNEIDAPWENDIQAKMFWKILNNLGITEEKFNDSKLAEVNENQSASEVADRIIWIKNTLERVNYRLYDESGEGGFFPLKHHQKNQRKVELWYQMHSWVSENGL